MYRIFIVEDDEVIARVLGSICVNGATPHSACRILNMCSPRWMPLPRN